MHAARKCVLTQLVKKTKMSMGKASGVAEVVSVVIGRLSPHGSDNIAGSEASSAGLTLRGAVLVRLWL